MFRPLKRLKLNGLVPLPGVGELERAAKGLIDVLKSSGYKNEQCESITSRFESLLEILHPAGQLESVQTVLRQLGDIKDEMEADLKRKLSTKLAGAEYRLEVLERAEKQIDKLIVGTLMRRWVAREIDSSNESGKKKFEENLRIIPEYEITSQELVRSVTTRVMLSSQIGEPSFKTVSDSEDCVTICHRTGYFGNLRVSYRTFSSVSDDAAAERAEMELKALSKALHPSISTLVGVTKGYYGLNGVVAAMAGLSHTEFLLKSVSGAALARCMKEMQEVADLFEAGHFGAHIDNFHVEGVNIEHNGHVTVLPRSEGDRLSSRGIELLPCEILNPTRNDTGSNLALRIYSSTVQECAIKSDLPLHANRAMDHIRRFANRLSELNAGFSRLDVIRIAAEERMEPFRRLELLRFNHSPPFTLMHGDIVYPLTSPAGKITWHVFEEGNELPTTHSVVASPIADSWNPPCRKLGANREYCTWLVGYCDSDPFIHIRHRVESTTWQHVLQKMKHVSKGQSFNTDILSFCYGICLTVKIRRPKYRGNVTDCPEQLYYHRSQSDRSSPRQFWGFFSGNPDPYAPSTLLEDLGWTFEYDVDLDLMHVCEDWKRVYERAKEVDAGDIWIEHAGDYDESEWGIAEPEDEISDGEISDERPSDEEPLDEKR